MNKKYLDAMRMIRCFYVYRNKINIKDFNFVRADGKGEDPMKYNQMAQAMKITKMGKQYTNKL